MPLDEILGSVFEFLKDSWNFWWNKNIENIRKEWNELHTSTLTGIQIIKYLINLIYNYIIKKYFY